MGGLNVTIRSQVAVYAPAERAEKLHLFLLYPFLLCGIEFRLKIQGIWRPLDEKNKGREENTSN
jgi:hypothetical protein